MHPETVIVGASGYIGGRLVDSFIADGTLASVAGRRRDALIRRWPEAHALELDVLRPDTIEPELREAETVYYLVHSMAAGEAGFEERDGFDEAVAEATRRSEGAT